MKTIVEARFAGGSILVGTGSLLDREMVAVEVPGQGVLHLFTHEARALATALTNAAAGVSR